MNKRSARFSPRLIVATVALNLGLAANAFAAPPAGGPCAPGNAHSERHMTHMQNEISRVHDQLKLDPAQEALWKEAEQGSLASMGGMRDRMCKQRDEIRALVAQPGADLRAVARRMDEARGEELKQHNAMRDRWLAVYDKLNPEQKEQVRVFLQTRFERMEKHGPGGRRPAGAGPAGPGPAGPGAGRG